MLNHHQLTLRSHPAIASMAWVAVPAQVWLLRLLSLLVMVGVFHVLPQFRQIYDSMGLDPTQSVSVMWSIGDIGSSWPYGLPALLAAYFWIERRWLSDLSKRGVIAVFASVVLIVGFVVMQLFMGMLTLINNVG